MGRNKGKKRRYYPPGHVPNAPIPGIKKNHIKDVTIVMSRKSPMNENILQRVISECQTPLFYHKFIIRFAHAYDRNYILKSIMDFVYPSTFMPVHFTETTETPSRCYFLARNCIDVIMKIIGNKFLIRHHLNPPEPFVITIMANCIISEEVLVEDNSQILQGIILKRFNEETKMLNLNNFSDDIDLNEYCPLFNEKFFGYVMEQSVALAPKIVDLQNNYIRNISSISVLNMCLEVLDISNNEIEDINTLSALTEFKNLKVLILSGNPLCDKYCNYNYVLDVKKYCPYLEKLDGVNVNVASPEFRKNFLCTEVAEDLAAQFIENFLSTYDSSNRSALKDFYDEYAILSVNSKIIPNQQNSNLVRLNHYGLENPYVVYGTVDIMKLYQEFPKSWHDPYPTVCDITVYTDTHAYLVISGIFKEHNQILSFNRSFYFKRIGEQFLITNEQLHVSNALDYQIGWSFKFPVEIQVTGSPLPYFYEQYKELDCFLHKLTKMNLVYCQKYLTFCNYDLKKTLALFSELHVNNEVPQEAFKINSDVDAEQIESPINEALQKKISAKEEVISLKTIWTILNSERSQSSTDFPITGNPTINKIYRKPIFIPTNFNTPPPGSNQVIFPCVLYPNTFNKVDVVPTTPNYITLNKESASTSNITSEYSRRNKIDEGEDSSKKSLLTNSETSSRRNSNIRSPLRRSKIDEDKFKSRKRSRTRSPIRNRRRSPLRDSRKRRSKTRSPLRDSRKRRSKTKSPLRDSRKRRSKTRSPLRESKKSKVDEDKSSKRKSDSAKQSTTKITEESSKKQLENIGSIRKSRFDVGPGNTNEEIKSIPQSQAIKTPAKINKISFSIATPPVKEPAKGQNTLLEHATRMAKYKEMALQKIAELKTNTGSVILPTSPNQTTQQNQNPFVKPLPVANKPKTLFQPENKIWKYNPGTLNFIQTEKPVGEIQFKEPKKVVQVPRPIQVLSNCCPVPVSSNYPNLQNIKGNLGLVKNDNDSKKEVTDSKKTSSPLKEVKSTKEDAPPKEIKLVKEDAPPKEIKPAKENAPSKEKDDVSKIRQDFQKQKENLILLKDQLNEIILCTKQKSLQNSKDKNPSSSSTLLSTESKDKKKLIKELYGKLQDGREKLLKLKAELDKKTASKKDQNKESNSVNTDNSQPSTSKSNIATNAETKTNDSKIDKKNSSGSDVATPPPPRSFYEFIIKQSLIGKLMGAQGSFVMEVRNKTSAMMILRSHPTNTHMQICSVEGTKSQITMALRMIRNKFPRNDYPEVTLEHVDFMPKFSTVSSFRVEKQKLLDNGELGKKAAAISTLKKEESKDNKSLNNDKSHPSTSKSDENLKVDSDTKIDKQPSTSKCDITDGNLIEDIEKTKTDDTKIDKQEINPLEESSNLENTPKCTTETNVNKEDTSKKIPVRKRRSAKWRRKARASEPGLIKQELFYKNLLHPDVSNSTKDTAKKELTGIVVQQKLQKLEQKVIPTNDKLDTGISDKSESPTTMIKGTDETNVNVENTLKPGIKFKRTGSYRRKLKAQKKRNLLGQELLNKKPLPVDSSEQSNLRSPNSEDAAKKELTENVDEETQEQKVIPSNERLQTVIPDKLEFSTSKSKGQSEEQAIEKEAPSIEPNFSEVPSTEPILSKTLCIQLSKLPNKQIIKEEETETAYSRINILEGTKVGPKEEPLSNIRKDTNMDASSTQDFKRKLFINIFQLSETEMLKYNTSHSKVTKKSTNRTRKSTQKTKRSSKRNKQNPFENVKYYDDSINFEDTKPIIEKSTIETVKIKKEKTDLLALKCSIDVHNLQSNIQLKTDIKVEKPELLDKELQSMSSIRIKTEQPDIVDEEQSENLKTQSFHIPESIRKCVDNETEKNSNAEKSDEEKQSTISKTKNKNSSIQNEMEKTLVKENSTIQEIIPENLKEKEFVSSEIENVNSNIQNEMEKTELVKENSTIQEGIPENSEEKEIVPSVIENVKSNIQNEMEKSELVKENSTIQEGIPENSEEKEFVSSEIENVKNNIQNEIEKTELVKENSTIQEGIPENSEEKEFIRSEIENVKSNSQNEMEKTKLGKEIELCSTTQIVNKKQEDSAIIADKTKESIDKKESATDSVNSETENSEIIKDNSLKSMTEISNKKQEEIEIICKSTDKKQTSASIPESINSNIQSGIEKTSNEKQEGTEIIAESTDKKQTATSKKETIKCNIEQTSNKKGKNENDSASEIKKIVIDVKSKPVDDIKSNNSEPITEDVANQSTSPSTSSKNDEKSNNEASDSIKDTSLEKMGINEESFNTELTEMVENMTSTELSFINNLSSDDEKDDDTFLLKLFGDI